MNAITIERAVLVRAAAALADYLSAMRAEASDDKDSLMARIRGADKMAHAAYAELYQLLEAVARPCCPSCGTHEVSQQQACHNSACESYARDVTIYEGWRVQESSLFAPEPSDDQETPRKLGADGSGVALPASPLRFHQWPEAAKVAYERLEQRLNGDEAALLYQLQQALAAGVKEDPRG